MVYKKMIFLSALISILYITSCTGSLMQKNAEFENRTWILQSFNYEDVSNPEGKIYLEFDKGEKKISGFGGCNNFFGAYSITGSDLKIKPGRTKMACDDMKIEDRLMELLGKTTEFREITSSDKEYLRLLTSNGESIEFRLKK